MNIDDVKITPKVTELRLLINKYIAVLDSCKTYEQLKVCMKYADLVSKRIDQIQERA